jgi:hypothetical protein
MQADPGLNNVEKLQEALGWQFLRAASDDVTCDDVTGTHRGFTLVRPDEGWFPGINGIKEELNRPQCDLGKAHSFKVRATVQSR